MFVTRLVLKWLALAWCLCAGDQPPAPFCHLNETIDPDIRDRQHCTFITASNTNTHKVIRDALHLVPTFLGNGGKGQGPRCVPSCASLQLGSCTLVRCACQLLPEH